MPRSPKPSKPENEMTAVELAESKLKLAIPAFLKTPTTAQREAVHELIDLYAGAYAAQFT
jgi:hypothetical protein